MSRPFEPIDRDILKILKDSIRVIPDFPVKGILYKDITPLLKNRETLEITQRMLSRPFRGLNVDYVVGLESRGFLFGTNIAQDLHAGFIPVRKPNKLPSDKIRETYQLEYGNDSVEMHSDAIEKGARVLIHDDLIATGGTAKAATSLVKQLGGTIVGYSFLIELQALEGGNALEPGVPVHSLIRF